MKKFKYALTSLFIGLSVATAAHASTPSFEESETLRQNVSQAYNRLASLNDAEFVTTLQRAADTFASQGDVAKANALRALAQPQLKPIILEKIKDQVDHSSENGLFWFIALFPCSNDPMFHDAGDCLLSILLGFVTFDGDAAQAF